MMELESRRLLGPVPDRVEQLHLIKAPLSLRRFDLAESQPNFFIYARILTISREACSPGAQRVVVRGWQELVSI
jgi:hypothetical protein